MTWLVYNSEDKRAGIHQDKTIEVTIAALRLRGRNIDILLDIDGVVFVWRDLNAGLHSPFVVYVKQPT